jgi:hypothetical protein
VIGKAIRKSGETGSGGTIDAFVPAVAYICGKATEIVLHNFMSADWRYAAADMIRTAEMNARVRRPFYHLVLCWQPDERPNLEDQIAAMAMMLKRLGLSEHQTVIATHDDRDHLHVHAAINTVHPTTRKVWSKNHDHVRIEKACREIELHFGWPHDNGRFDVTINDDGDVQLRPAYDRWKKKEAARASGSRKPTSADITFEKKHGLPSFSQAIPKGLRDRFGEIATNAKTWNDLHSALAEIGLVYLRKGSGAAISIMGSTETAKASVFGQAFTLSRMEKRLGTFVGPPDVARAAKTIEISMGDRQNRLQAVSSLPKHFSTSSSATGFKLTLLRRTYTNLFLDEAVAAQIKFVNLSAVPPFVTFQSGGKVVDRGSEITTNVEGDDAIKLMVAMAVAKGWSAVKFTGSPTFVRQAAIIAAEAGLPVAEVPADIQELVDSILAKAQKAQADADAAAVEKPDAAISRLDAADPCELSQAKSDGTPEPRADGTVRSDKAATIPDAPVASVDDHRETFTRQPATTKRAVTADRPAPSQPMKAKAAGSAQIWRKAPAIDHQMPNLATDIGISAATLDRFSDAIRIGANGTLMFACRNLQGSAVFGIQRENVRGHVETHGRAGIAVLGDPKTAKRVVFVTSGLNALALAEIENTPETLYISLRGQIDDRIARNIKKLCRDRHTYDARRPEMSDRQAGQDLCMLIPNLLELSADYLGISLEKPDDSWLNILNLLRDNGAQVEEIEEINEESSPSFDESASP